MRVKKLRAVKQLPSTNTKTKLDLTKLIRDSHEPLIIVCKCSDYFCYIIIIVAKKSLTRMNFCIIGTISNQLYIYQS